MNLLLPLLVLVLTPSSPTPVATLQLVEDHGHIFVRGSIGTAADRWLAVDTGAARSVLDSDLAAAIGIEARGHAQTSGVGGTVDTAVARDVQVSLGGASLGPHDFDLLALGDLSRHIGLPVALILGFELFDLYVVEVDYEQGVLRLYEPKTFKPSPAAVSVPIDVIENHPYVKATVRTPAGAAIRGRFVIDLGSSNSVIFTPATVRKYRLLDSTHTSAGRGAGIGAEQIKIHSGRMGSLALGPFTVPQVLALLPESGVFADAEDAIGNLGGGLLRRFRVTFDYSRRRMLLQPNRWYGQTEEPDLSGLALAASGDGLREVVVERVKEGSPGAEAGFQSGDRLLAIDGSKLGELALFRLRERFRHVGEHHLELARGEQRVNVVLRTRRST